MNTTGSSDIDFDTFCHLMEVEGTGEYRELFHDFDDNNDEKIDIKEFMLGLLNFTHTEREQRIKFRCATADTKHVGAHLRLTLLSLISSCLCLCSFKIFDEDHNGFLTEEELIQMLKSNHMTTEANVLKKAKTIMKQADVDGDGHITLEQFVVISEKFPNILFPPNGGASAD